MRGYETYFPRIAWESSNVSPTRRYTAYNTGLRVALRISEFLGGVTKAGEKTGERQDDYLHIHSS